MVPIEKSLAAIPVVGFGDALVDEVRRVYNEVGHKAEAVGG